MTTPAVFVRPEIKLRNAKKELGFGMPPSFFGPDAAAMLSKILTGPTSRGVIVETASWTVDLPMSDANIAVTFGKAINVFGTPDGKPPPGVADASNTLQVPGMPNADMVLLGINVRVLVEPEARTIDGNASGLPLPGNTTPLPSPDTWTQKDLLNGSIIPMTAGEVPVAIYQADGILPGLLLWGLPTWRVGYAFVKAYDLNWMINNQESMIREPLTEVATIQPFAEAEAAGNAFTSNTDRIRVFNNILQQLGVPNIFHPISHRRLGTVLTGAGTPIGDFTASREQDTSGTVFGGIGVTTNPVEKSPLIFAVPVYWPSGQPIGINFTVHSEVNQTEMQRWLSVTGGNGGNAGQDLNFPYSALVNGFTPQSATLTVEQSLDATQTLVSQGPQTNRFLGKAGRMVFEVGLVGLRIGQAWKSAVYDAINKGAIQAPVGTGTLGSA